MLHRLKTDLAHVSLLILLLLSIVALPLRALGQNNSSNIDDDFYVQGEYLGGLRLDGGHDRAVGLQVIALGDGKFDAVLYPGGLPGAGWDSKGKRSLSGETRGDVTQLAGDGLAIQIEPGSFGTWCANVRDKNHEHLGWLRKIHRVSPTMGLAPNYAATVLFNGYPPDHLDDATLTHDGLLKVGATSRMPVGDFYLHMEFRTPYEPADRGQARGNSGVYIQRRYEVQILDSFGLTGEPNECGGLYRQRSPDLNMCLPPRSWQTYDIYFTEARWDDQGKKAANARITVLHNGVPVHNDAEIIAKTGAGREETPEHLPIHWQNHGDDVQFRNMWIVMGLPSAEAGAPSLVTSTAYGAPWHCFIRHVVARAR